MIKNGHTNRNNCYMELLIPSYSAPIDNLKDVSYNVYSTYEMKNSIQTTDSHDVIIKDPRIIVNDKRRWMMDKMCQLLNDIPLNTPLYVGVRFVSFPHVESRLKWIAEVSLNKQSCPYTIHYVKRKTIFVYEPNKPVYMLINFLNGNPHIYVMQSLNLQTFENNVDYIGKLLELPENWLWTSMILDSDTYLKVVSCDTASLIQDSLGNSYQYLESKYAPWLYEQCLFSSLI